MLDGIPRNNISTRTYIMCGRVNHIMALRPIVVTVRNVEQNH